MATGRMNGAFSLLRLRLAAPWRMDGIRPLPSGKGGYAWTGAALPACGCAWGDWTGI